MPVLRSRQIPSATTPPPQQPSKLLKSAAANKLLEPPTPVKIKELLSLPSSLPRRRSLRLSPHSAVSSAKRSRNDSISSMKVEVLPTVKRQRNQLNDTVSGVDFKAEEDMGNGGSGDARVLDSSVDVEMDSFLSLRSGARVAKRVSSGCESDCGVDKKLRKKKGVLIEGESNVKVEEEESGLRSRDERKLRSSRRYCRAEKGKRKMSVNDDVVVSEVGLEEEEFNLNRSPRKYTREEKGKAVVIDDGVGADTAVVSRGLGFMNDEGDLESNIENGTMYFDFMEFRSNVGVENGGQVPNVGQGVVEGGERIDVGRPTEMPLNEHRATRRLDQFKDIARRNALRFAHFSARDTDDEDYEERRSGENAEVGGEEPQEQQPESMEDWPGPFSTAMKIIRDREKNLGSQAHKSSSGRGATPLVSWTPKEKDLEQPKRVAPSLQSMCMKILSENVDLIGSLNYVPDALRHTLCQLLCDSRKMNAHFFGLLLEGSPSEVRVTDCSWLEEEEFEKSFQACDTCKLTVLQLDLCGHCISDSSLIKALRHKGLPALATISLKGACRISDAGLRALVSAAPSLRSMNLSQCSLLTDIGIESIADSLGSILHELYLDDCDTLDAMRILPTLERLECLEVLSLRGIGGVSDKFLNAFITSNGQRMKELVLANCTNLTDSSLKVIAETCFQLCVLDLSYLRKLTDIGLAYLSNGCRKLQDLKLCRNTFSDDAVAAFLETCGETLKGLALNNTTKVGQNTTLSLARRCKNLESLDLSWCRSLTDDALGLIADSCSSLRLLKIFGCTQITKRFIDGHSNPNLQIIGMKLTPILDHIKRPDFQHGPLHYSAVPSC